MSYLDFPAMGQITFQDPASPIFEGIIDLHHNIFFFLLLILVQVFWMFYLILLRGNTQWERPNYINLSIFRKDYLTLTNLIHGTLLEVIWTMTPSIILILIALPSFALLYSVDEILSPEFTIKVVGHQWYWSYEINNSQSFDSYFVPLSQLEIGDLRLLEVDHRLICPTNTHLRFLITSTDVLHSFAVPSLGVKVDAVPGRINQISVYINRPGIFYGQCSELCGSSHALMPIVIQSI